MAAEGAKEEVEMKKREKRMSVWRALTCVLAGIAASACVTIGWICWQIETMSEWTDWKTTDLGGGA